QDWWTMRATDRYPVPRVGCRTLPAHLDSDIAPASSREATSSTAGRASRTIERTCAVVSSPTDPSARSTVRPISSTSGPSRPSPNDGQFGSANREFCDDPLETALAFTGCPSKQEKALYQAEEQGSQGLDQIRAYVTARSRELPHPPNAERHPRCG